MTAVNQPSYIFKRYGAVLTITALITLSVPQEAYAQAFCALRQPHRAQQGLFPESTSIETFTDEVTDQHRSRVQQELSFTIHEAELGLHTLYAVFKQEGESKRHLGYIHVRSEQGEWGLIEITWALYPNLNVKGFSFQRCRELARDEILSSSFTNFMHQKSSDQLRPLLNSDGTALKSPLPGLSEDAQSLGFRLIRSVLKTIAVTKVVWPNAQSTQASE